MEEYLAIGSSELDDPLLYRRKRTIVSQPYKLNRQTRSQSRPTRTPSRLCKYCKELISHWPRVLGQEASLICHHKDFASLQKSADQGCGLCTQFIVGAEEIEEWWDYLEADGSVPARGVAVYEPKARYFWSEDYMRLKLLIPCDFGALGYKVAMGDLSEPSRLTLEVDMFPAEQRACNYDSRVQYPSTLDALPLCRQWLDLCLTKHRRCGKITPGQVPSRLIEICSSTSRIILSEQLTGPISYVTLSHCWGTSHNLTLERNNLQAFQDSIPYEALPKTFQDAIYITRYLGFKYLWIDSLCIMQDDENDWKQESALMASVYGGGILNIAATSAEDSGVGYFFQRDPTWRTQVQVPSKDGGILYDCVPQRLMFPYKVPLIRRAWAVQERYLSRRTLHFYEQQVFWECDRGGACEIYPDGYMDGLRDGNMFFTIKRPFTLARWSKILLHYTRGRLTRDSDKLVAVAGLAQVIQAETRDDYIAGMWRRNLEDQLCWDVLEAGQRITPYQAPTWSWASLHGTVNFPDYQSAENPKTLFIEVQNVNFEYASENRFGPVKSATLHLACRSLCHGTLRSAKDIAVMFLVGSLLVEITPQFDFEVDDVEKESDTCDDSNVDQLISREMYLLPVKLQSIHKNVEGLLLQRKGTKKGQYERLGTYFSSSDKFDELCRVAESQAVPDDFVGEYRTKDGNMQRLLYLV